MKGMRVIAAFLLILSAVFSIRLALAMEDEEAALVREVARISREEEAERKRKLAQEEEQLVQEAIARAEKEERELQRKEEVAVARAITESKIPQEAQRLKTYLNELVRVDLKDYGRDKLEKILNYIEAYRNLTGFKRSFEPLEKRVQHALNELAQKEIELARQKEALAKEKTKIVERSIHIISPATVEKAGLWPLYPNGYTASIEGQEYTFNSPMTYHDIKTFKTIIDDNPSDKLPGYRELSAQELNIPANNKKRYLMQLKTFNQEVFENANSLCWALALRNALLLSSFVYTGDIKFMQELPSIDNVKSFLDYYKLNELVAKQGAQSMFTKEQVEKFVQVNLAQRSPFVIDPFYVSKENVTIMATPFEADATNWFVEENDPTINVIKKVSEGLKQHSFFHAFVLGEDELAVIFDDKKVAGHYIVFVVVKVSNNIIYAIADTKADHYYIGPDNSYEYQKVLHFIETLEKGSSKRISLEAIRASMAK